MTKILIHLTVQDIGLQRWRRVRCALGLNVCNTIVNTLEGWWGKLTSWKRKVDTKSRQKVDGCGAHMDFRGEDLKEEV